jgi:hypothetical protein
MWPDSTQVVTQAEDAVVVEDVGVVVVDRTEVVSEEEAGEDSEVEAAGAEEGTIRIINQASRWMVRYAWEMCLFAGK